MRHRTRLVVACTIFLAMLVAGYAARFPLGSGPIFLCYLLLCLVSACFKVALPGYESALSFNVPYIMLSIMWLPLPAALIAAGASALVMCTFRVSPPNSAVQILFNLANAVNSTALAWFLYQLATKVSGQTLPSLVLAATVYFAVNSVSVAAVLTTLQNESLLTIWRHFLWTWPYYPIGALLASLTYYVEIHSGRLSAQMILPLAYLIYYICRNYATTLVERHKHASEMAALHLRTIETLALAIEAKDQNTHEHLCRVRVYAAGIASKLKLTSDETEALMAAALLHDIGKLAVPEAIINKPGKLTPAEFDRMKIHPVVGAQILERISFPYPVAPIVRSHHEHWDGGGYPDGLKGTEIPIGARILSAVDCFDALASDRPYRRALPLSGAVEYVKGLAGVQFDPEVVRILCENYQELEAQANAETGKIEPLNIAVPSYRGLAPSAGFEQGGFAATGGHRDRLVSKAHRQLESEITRMIALTLEAPDLDDALPCVAAALGAIIPFDMLVIYTREGEVLRPYYVSGVVDEGLPPALLPVGKGLCGWVAHTRQTILNGNPAVEAKMADPRMERMRSSIAVPLVDAEDSAIGVLALYHAQADAFNSAHLALLLPLQPSFASFLQAATKAVVAPDEKQQVHPENWRSLEADVKIPPQSPFVRGVALATSR